MKKERRLRKINKNKIKFSSFNIILKVNELTFRESFYNLDMKEW